MNALGSGVHWREGARNVWRVVRWILLAIVLLYIFAVIYSIPHAMQEDKDAKAVAQIQAQKITMDDVDGNHLPPPPDPNRADVTIAGIDANGNGIRDDVELAIFNKYPGQSNIKIRAAELQYAMELQMMLTQVFDSETWKTAAIQEDRGYQCIAETYPRKDLKNFVRVTDARTQEVEQLVLNTNLRAKAKENAYNFETSVGLPNDNFCDLN